MRGDQKDSRKVRIEGGGSSSSRSCRRAVTVRPAEDGAGQLERERGFPLFANDFSSKVDDCS